jgi:hypothetical protein
MILAWLAACSDQGVHAIDYDAIAVVLGDFDDMRTPLTGLKVGTRPFDGFIVQAVYDTSDERPVRGEAGESVEQLFGAEDENGNPVVSTFSAIFVNSGTRGLGRLQYNDAFTEDDAILADGDMLDNACNFAEGGGVLVVTDWAYDLVESCWPDAIDFVHDDTLEPDAAQTGVAESAILADVVDAPLAERLGSAVLAVDYDYSAWSVIEGVADDTEVLIEGAVQYQPSAEEAIQTLPAAPMLVRFHPGYGLVVFSTFHLASQGTQVAQMLLLGAVEGLEPGAGADSGGDTG